jgi:hypothetical protein
VDCPEGSDELYCPYREHVCWPNKGLSHHFTKFLLNRVFFGVRLFTSRKDDYFSPMVDDISADVRGIGQVGR